MTRFLYDVTENVLFDITVHKRLKTDINGYNQNNRKKNFMLRMF